MAITTKTIFETSNGATFDDLEKAELYEKINTAIMHKKRIDVMNLISQMIEQSDCFCSDIERKRAREWVGEKYDILRATFIERS